MRMDPEMNDISHSDFTPFMIVESLEMSDEPKYYLNLNKKCIQTITKT